mgnify:CR=1 FL=1
MKILISSPPFTFLLGFIKGLSFTKTEPESIQFFNLDLEKSGNNFAITESSL